MPGPREPALGAPQGRDWASSTSIHFGLRVDRIASRGTLNAPWGLAVAPPSFGDLAGVLLVGNVGDGRISAYCGDRFAGQLNGANGHPLAIDGLWALLPGTASAGGTANVWFCAGPADESQELVGLISPAEGLTLPPPFGFAKAPSPNGG